jgi:hypothetical protein
MPDTRTESEILRTMLARLERISVDSHWSHRASGLRGALLKALEIYEQGGEFSEAKFQLLMSSGFDILTNAAREK